MTVLGYIQGFKRCTDLQYVMNIRKRFTFKKRSISLRHLVNIITVVMFSVLSTSLLFTGCTKQPKEIEQVKEIVFPVTMYVKKDAPPFKQGQSVSVLSIDGDLAITQEGKIPLSNLEEQRSTFRLTINTQPSATIRILNIKPKYSDGMWLSPGQYHIQITQPGYKTYEKWITVDNDITLNIQLKISISKANGTISWLKEEHLFSTGDRIWYYAEDEAEKMNWQAATEYCRNLDITTYGYHSSDFMLPTDTELLQLYRNKPLIVAPNIYWTSTTDSEHESYAKYVNLGSGANSWYKKYGKTYTMCLQQLHYPEKLSLQELASALFDQEMSREISLVLIEEKPSLNQRALDALQMALFVKYGSPLIRNVAYNAEKRELTFDLISQNHDEKGVPYYQKKVTLEVENSDAQAMRSKLTDPNFTPIVEFKVTEGQLSFIGI